MNLRWRCIDCHTEGESTIPDNAYWDGYAYLTLDDVHSEVMNQHIAKLMAKLGARGYVRGNSDPSPMDATVSISFVSPGPTTIRSENGKLILEATQVENSPQFEVRHVR